MGYLKIFNSREIEEDIKRNYSTYIKHLRVSVLKILSILVEPLSSIQYLGNLIRKVLKPSCKIILNFVRGGMDILPYLPKRVPQEIILISSDVTCLYNAHNLGIEAINFSWRKHSSHIENVSETFSLKGFKSLLETNHFTTTTSTYRFNGTAIGTNINHTYVILVMCFLEAKFYSKLTETL